MARHGSPEDRALRRLGIKILLSSVLGLLGIVCFQILGYFVATAMGAGSETSALGLAIIEGASALGAVLVTIALGGRSWVSTSRDDLVTTFHFGWGVLVVSILFGILGSVMSVFEGDSISADWYMTALLMVVGCIGIGLMEEFLFRGVIFNGLLAVMGKTHRGLMGAIAIVSVLFGLAHLDFTQDLVDPIMWCQAIFKIVQTGMYSVILCTIVLRTRRLGGVSLLHCLSDLALMLPAVALFGESLETEYVTSGEDGVAGIALYAVVCAMYLPFVVRSLRALKRDQDAYRGVFFERALRRKKAKEERKSLRNMPVESDGRPTLPRVTAEDEGRPTLPHRYEEDEGLDGVTEK